MVLNATDRLTAIEAAKRNNQNQDARRIIEALRQTNEIMMDIPVVKANNDTVHKHLVRTSLPKATVRTLNQGVNTTSSTTKVVSDTMTQLAVYSIVDRDLVDRQQSPDEFLTGEETSFIEGMGQQQADMFVYGSTDQNPSAINGFAARRKKLSDFTCVSAGGSGNALTSIYLVKAGITDGMHYIYPKGSNSIGVEREDDGIVDATDENGKHFKAYQSYFSCNFGLSLGNEKSLIRIANIDPKTAKGDDLIGKLITLMKKLPSGDGTVVAYMNSDMLNVIDLALAAKGNVQYTMEDPWGKAVTTLRGIRMRQVDSILNTESAVTA